MSEHNQMPDPLPLLPKVVEDAENTVKDCEKLHLDRLEVFYTRQEFDAVATNCQRLQHAANMLSRLVNDRKSEFSQMAAKQAHN